MDPSTPFAHASEAEMARILDFYAVRWEYEPETFPILWNLDGDVVESFSPDFYLPELDLYLEMTTLRQRLVRKKNRKLRRLRELYPGISIKLFYARDFRALMLKYGKVALVDGLSGSLGQVKAPHGEAVRIVDIDVALPIADVVADSQPIVDEPASVDLVGGQAIAAAAVSTVSGGLPVEPGSVPGSASGPAPALPGASAAAARRHRRRRRAAASAVVSAPAADTPVVGA